MLCTSHSGLDSENDDKINTNPAGGGAMAKCAARPQPAWPSAAGRPFFAWSNKSMALPDQPAHNKINLALAAELAVKPQQVAAAVALLDEGATVPFIARYRKEVTD